MKFLHPAFLICLISTFLFSCKKDRGASFDVIAGAYDRSNSLVSIKLPERWKNKRFFTLQNLENDHYIPSQWDQGKLVFLLDQPLAAGEKRVYHLSPVVADDNETLVKVGLSGGKLTASVGEKTVFSYQLEEALPPEGSPAYYRRSGFLHPLFSPSGQVLTDDFPADHMHQHGIFTAWTKADFEGRRVDFWNQHKELGTVAHTELIDSLDGPVFGRMVSRLHHIDLTGPEGPEPVINESWVVSIYGLGEYFLFDLKSTQSLNSMSELKLLRHPYGGLGLRFSDQWYDPEYGADSTSMENQLGPGKGGFLTSDGLDRTNGNHSRPDWVCAFGNIDGQSCGLAVMGHSENFLYPQPARLHPEMPYFSLSPVVLGDFSLQPGDRLVSRYRFLSFAGEPDSLLINQAWQDYSNPPHAQWLEP